MKRVLIIGSGPSGLISGIVIKRKCPSLDVSIYESYKFGKKILTSGNGKANISNLNLDPDFYNHPQFVRDVLIQFSYDKLNEFFKSLGMLLKSDQQGRVYPYNDSASSVLEVLMDECHKLNIKMIKGDKIKKLDGDYNIIATGGGSYDLALSIGHHLTKIKPALCPLIIKDLEGLDGIRIKCKARIGDYINEGEIQFKKDGISGILGFQISSIYAWTNNKMIYLDLFPNYEVNELKQILLEYSLNKSLGEAFKGIINNKVMLKLMEMHKINYQNINKNNFKEWDILAFALKNWKLEIIGSYDFKDAQVTNGGIAIDEVSNLTFASKIKNDTYLIGEVLDIDGSSGGYNMHFAFASGYLAAIDIIRKEER